MKSKMVLVCFVFTILLGLVFTGSNNALAQPPCPGLVEATLFAGQNIDAGTVSVCNDSGKIAEAQIYAGDGYDLDTCNPTLGHFPYIRQYVSPVPIYQLTLDLEFDLPPGPIIAEIAVHADLVQLDDEGNVIAEEGAWARPGDGGYEFECAQWGWWFTYEIAHAPRP
jgi:hypothetical protein